MKFQNAAEFHCISIFLTELRAQTKIIILLSHARRLPYKSNFVEQRFHSTLSKTNGDSNMAIYSQFQKQYLYSLKNIIFWNIEISKGANVH